MKVPDVSQVLHHGVAPIHGYKAVLVGAGASMNPCSASNPLQLVHRATFLGVSAKT